MTYTIIITLSILLLLAYVFDISSSKTKIPSVILLLLLGFFVKQISQSFNILIPDLNPILPTIGTVGLILIVLEGALELEFNKEKKSLILKSSIVALLPILFISFGLAYYLFYYESIDLKIALANAIPFAIISSSIAIPSAKYLMKSDREFVTYESSMSDIFGVIFFNFITLNDDISSQAVGLFGFQFVLMLIISFVATLLLAGFLNKIKHHIKFVPMIIILLLIYATSKIFHLPALLFILIFGLFVGNIDELRHIKFIQQFHPDNFTKEVVKFREITTELAFLIRAIFFILFGFLINIDELFNPKTIYYSLSIFAGILIIRYLVLKLFRIPSNPLLYIAPRGLITILLFLSIPESQQLPFIDKSMITQVIILSAFVMMFGLMNNKNKVEKTEEVEEAN
ncbi:MAG: cation:proton antiporter [Saprospiraceae bacterium]|nr:cation:proton antiporter [Saprospiraceae bacterium]